MSDKTFLFIIVVLIALGIYSYQQALHERGGVTPLMELWEGRSGQDSDAQRFEKKIDTFTLQQDLQKLEDELAQLRNKKRELLEETEAYLRALLRLNVQLNRSAADHIQMVKDKKDSKEKFIQQLNELQDQVIGLAQLDTQAQRRAAFEGLQSQIIDTVNELMDEPDHELTVINQVLVETDQMLEGAFDPDRWGCATLQKCLVENIGLISQQVNAYIDRKIMQPIRRLEDIGELTQILDHEYKFLLVNTQGTYSEINENNKYLKKQLDSASKHLNELTTKHMAMLLKAMHAASTEQYQGLSNLQEHHDQFIKRYLETNQIFDQIMTQFKGSRTYDFSSLVNTYARQQKAAEEIFDQLRANFPLTIKLMARPLEENREALSAVAEHIYVDLDALKEEMGLTSMSDRLQESIQGLTTVQQPRESERQIEKRVISNDGRIQQMRQRSLEDEQTLKTMFEIYGP